MAEPAAPVESEEIASARVLEAIGRLRDVPASIPVVQEALRILDAPDCPIAELKVLLSSDQGVAARLLRLANSAYFGFRSEVRTISQTVVLLGPGRIRTTLSRILADEALRHLGYETPAAADIRRLSRATATASCLLSQMLLREDAEEMLLAGLLHNIGELVSLRLFPREYGQRAPSRGGFAVYGVTAGQAGRHLLASWNFPPLYPLVAGCWEDPVGLHCPPDGLFAAGLIHAARRLAEAFLARCGAAAAAQSLSPGLQEVLRFEDELFEAVYEALPQRISSQQLLAGRML
jgi:hypothetical protein